MNKKIMLLFIIAIVFSCQKPNEAISIEKITVNYFENPLGIDDLHPSFSWSMLSNERNKKQSAYQIKVAHSKKMLEDDSNLLWDSGKLKSQRNSQVRYAGKSLTSKHHYYYKIRVWDENDVASEWSETNFWTMGLLNQNDWKAKWIGFKTVDKNKQDTLHLPSAPYLRKSFSVKKPFRKQHFM